MLLKNISLINFRNFKNKKIDFHPSLTLISGMNSQGKTNILEGIHFLINGVGFRETKEEELLFFNEKEGLVEGNFDESGNITSYLIKLYFVGDKLNKVFFIDKTRKKHQQYLQQQTKTVLFSPEQINIIIGSPQLRRDYFDKLISLFDWEYKKRLVNYHLALKKRNKILELKADKENLKEELSFWDKYLIDQGSYLTKKREEYLDFLNSYQSLDSKNFYISYLKK
jgi:Recombinational DNA repair ATPase (RecF pathway)